MFGKNFVLNEHTMSIIEEIGRHMPGGFFIYRAEGDEELIYANDATISLFGCDDLDDFKEHTGYTFKGMLHPDDYATVTDSVNNQIRTSSENMDHVEYRIIRKDGSVRWIDDYGHYTETDNYGGIYYVFINILSNAIKFTDAPGDISFAIDRTNVFDDQSTLKFVIKDTGVGMDKSFIPKIFDSFTQEDSTKNNKYGSTGLGMAIAKNIV